MLENWNTNFFGWNAADFGWGADSIQNILWRLENGELDGVNPKIIVVLAGINNIPRALNDDQTVGRRTRPQGDSQISARKKRPTPSSS